MGQPGTRASEQLGLLWEDIDLGRNVISIRRVLNRDGITTETTKTEAGEREIPISPTLRTMLLEWRLICRRFEDQRVRVFPGPGMPQQWPLPRVGGGGPLLYSNFRRWYWVPGLKAAGVRYATIHSAHHAFVRNLQAQGVGIGPLRLWLAIPTRQLPLGITRRPCAVGLRPWQCWIRRIRGMRAWQAD